MEYSPPPLFKQGASARAKVVIFSLIAIALLVVDARLQTLGAIRQVVGTALYPLQRLAMMPRDAAYGVGEYFSTLTSTQEKNRQLLRQQALNAQTLQQVQLMAAENAHLRRLLGASERLSVKSLMAEILYDARDPFTRKIVLDRGSQQGVKPGQPVIDDTGVVGQVTRVFPFTAEVTLLTDKDQAIPVQVVRSGLRSVAYGQGQSGVLDLRFMPANADIRKGDVLVTSGIDGIYPAGLAVARVAQVEHKSSDTFAKIICQPAAGIDSNRQLLVLLTEFQMPVGEPAPASAPAPAPAPAKGEMKPAAKTEVKPAPSQPAPAALKTPAVPAAPTASAAPKPPAAPAAPIASAAPKPPAAPAAPTATPPKAAPAVPAVKPGAAAPVGPNNPVRPAGPAPVVKPAPAQPAAGAPAPAPAKTPAPVESRP